MFTIQIQSHLMQGAHATVFILCTSVRNVNNNMRLVDGMNQREKYQCQIPVEPHLYTHFGSQGSWGYNQDADIESDCGEDIH